jgi:phosphoribosylaminoimidazolecarboxamide formyltransferase/IMP cyclohydrolase
VTVLRRALLSVTDKSGLVDLARALAEGGVELVASGGTAAQLRQAGLPVTDVEAVTGFPEMLDGRVKTLHPALHAGLLADRGRDTHRADLERHGLRPIDLVVVNFYDFEAASAAHELPIEAIDIGGPTLVRAAAKNHAWVAVLTDPSDYDEFRAAWSSGRLDLAWRRRAAARAFQRIAAYDAAIAARFAHVVEAPAEPPATGARTWPAVWTASRPRLPLGLRYGENPHQAAAAYRDEPERGLARLRALQGGLLSYNNLLDADAAVGLVRDLGPRPACVLVKHNNPCGAARAATAAAAFTAARACDPLSAYGGIAAFNVGLDAEAAEALADLFLEVVCAPEVLPAARARLASKKKLRLLEVPFDPPSALVERQLDGLLLVQERDLGLDELQHLEVVTRRQPTDAERRDLGFLVAVCKHVRSNAIVVGRDERTLGIGAGQMSRVDSCDLAVRKARAAGHDLSGSVAVSDAFFPFADGVEVLAAAGVGAILQPGGSKRDAEVIEAADRLGLAMVLSHRRHFRH